VGLEHIVEVEEETPEVHHELAIEIVRRKARAGLEHLTPIPAVEGISGVHHGPSSRLVESSANRVSSVQTKKELA